MRKWAQLCGYVQPVLEVEVDLQKSILVAKECNGEKHNASRETRTKTSPNLSFDTMLTVKLPIVPIA